MKFLINLLFLISVLSFAQPSDLGYELNGSNDYLIIPNTSYINTSSSVPNRTIETWFKTNDATTKQVIYEEGGGVNSILIYLDSDRLYCGAYKSNGTSARFFRTANGEIKDDTWYHVAFVISTSGNTTTFLWYLNGELQDSTSGFPIPSHSGDIQLGRNGKLKYGNCGSWSASNIVGSNSENCSTASGNNTTKYYLNGNLWGLRIWNSVRTSSELGLNINNELNSGTNLVAYLDNDFVNYINNSGNWTQVRANGNNINYKWLSTATSSDWNHPGNWKGSTVPLTTNLRKIVIEPSNNYPVISSEVKIGELELTSPDSKITIEEGGMLNVYYKVVNEGTVQIKNNGSFTLQDASAVSGTGTFIIERKTPDYPADDYYSVWSTPIKEQDSQVGSIFTNNIVAYAYDASQNPSAYTSVSKSQNMEVGKGYFIRSDNDSGVLTRTFTGMPNNGTIEEPIYHNSDSDNFNLIGNPYTSALDWTSFYRDNSDKLSGTVYFWSQDYSGTTNSASDYISFNVTGSNDSQVSGKIGTGQGFFVKSLQEGTIKFKNTQRVVGSNNQFFRTSENSNDGKSWFRLSGSMGYSPILIGFIPGATDNYENTYDSEFINEGSAIEFYSLIDGNKYDIQGRSELQAEQNVQIPLGYQVLSAGDYVISVVLEYIDPDFDIILEDTLENTMTDLRISDYTFSVANPTEDNNRFILHYNYNQTLNTNEFTTNVAKIDSYFNQNELISKRSGKINPISITIYDVNGQVVLKSEYQDRIMVNNLSSGIYVVNYTLEHSEPISKKLIKR